MESTPGEGQTHWGMDRSWGATTREEEWDFNQVNNTTAGEVLTVVIVISYKDSDDFMY